jgi:hypothetical protein
MLRLLSTLFRAAFVGASLSFLPASVSADTPGDGFQLTSLPYPLVSRTATFSDGKVVAFDGTNVDLFDADGNLISNLGVLTSPGYPSFVLLDPTEDFVVLGESTFGVIYELGLSPGAPNPITTLVFNYDAVFEDDEHLIVSAATNGFGGGNQIYRVDVFSGASTLLASVSGASGPVALDPAGNLLYGTVSGLFPSPAGSSSVVRWPAAALTGSPVLSEADATLIEGGFDGAADLALDPVGGGLYLAENNFGSGVNRIRLVAGNPLVAPILVEGLLGRSLSNLEFFAGDGVARFAGFQPESGGTLLYNTTDFSAAHERLALLPLRPALAVSGPGVAGSGPFAVDVVDAPPGGFAYVFYSPASSLLSSELVLNLRIPLFLGLAPSATARAPGVLLVGANGTGHATGTSPGGLAGNWALQAVVFDASGRIAGSSSAILFQ